MQGNSFKRSLAGSLALSALLAQGSAVHFLGLDSPKNSEPESVPKDLDKVPDDQPEGDEHPTRNGRKPVDITLHFINAAARHKLHNNEITLKQAMKEVPIYAGLDNRTYRQLKQNLKYARKVRSEAWMAKAAEIKGAAHV